MVFKWWVEFPHVFSVVFFNALQKVSGMQNTETPGRNILARFDPRPAGAHVEGWGCHNVSNTGIFFCPLFPAWNTRVWLLSRDWMFYWAGGLVSYSGCQQEGTHSRHPDRQGPLRTRALGWPRPSGLHHPQNNLVREGRKGCTVVSWCQTLNVSFDNIHKIYKT